MTAITLRNSIIGGGIAAFIALIVLLSYSQIAYGNPLFVSPLTKTAAATTTTQYLVNGGAATTTVYKAAQSGDQFLPFKANALFQVTATTTVSVASSTLKARIEYSVDDLEWYPEPCALNANATTTLMNGNFCEYQWQYATSTDNGGSGSASVIYKTLPVSVLAPFTRVKWYVPLNATNVGLWAEIVPLKEQP